MQFCKSHWSDLRKAIDDRGLTHLVSLGGKAAAASLLNSTTEEEDRTNGFDPLLRAWMMLNARVMSNAEHNGGRDAVLWLLSSDVCPMCEAMKCKAHGDHPEAAKEMIQGCTDSLLAYCRKLGIDKMKPQRVM